MVDVSPTAKSIICSAFSRSGVICFNAMCVNGPLLDDVFSDAVVLTGEGVFGVDVLCPFQNSSSTSPSSSSSTVASSFLSESKFRKLK